MPPSKPTTGTRVRALAVIVVLAAVAAACGSDGDGQATTTPESAPAPTTTADADGSPTDDPLAPRPLPEHEEITVAVAGYKAEGFSPLYLASHFGEFEEENLGVEVVVINPGDALVSFMSGEVDVYAAGFLANIFNAIEGGVDMSWVASAHESPPESGMGFWARDDLLEDGELDPCDVEGKVVSLGGATGYAGAGAWSMAEFLEGCDLKLTDFELSLLGGADLVLAMEQGAVDIGFLADPAWVPLDEAGVASLVVPSYPEPLGGYIISDLGEREPEVLDAFLRAMLRVTRGRLQGDYKSDPETLAALSDELDAPEESILAVPSLVFDPSLTVDPRPVDAMQAIWYDIGDILVGEPIPSEEVIDMSHVERVLGG